MGELDFSAVEKGQEDSANVELADNIVEDMIDFSRGNVIANEEQFLLTQCQYSSAFMYSMDRYLNSILIGPSAGGKTQVQKAAKKLLPSDVTYTATELTGSAAQDDRETWNKSLLAPLDEVDKIGDTVREFLKSMAGEDEGYKKKRSVQDDEAESGRSTVTLHNHAMPYQVLFAPEDKSGIPKELDNRLLKLYVEDNKHIREAIGRKEAGHTNIEVSGLEHTYIYPTHDLEGALRANYRELPTVTEMEDGNEYRRGALYVKMPEWVWYATKSIFDFSTTSTNRYFGMVFNAIRGSAVINHKNRETVEIEVDRETKEALLVEPQDVANVLSCQRTLLGTTHELDPQKRQILAAVREITDANGEGATLTKVKDRLSSSDMSVPSKSVLRRILKEDLAEGFYIKVREGDGPNGSDLYVFRSRGAISPPRLHNLNEVAERDGVDLDGYGVDVDDPFKGTADPIRDQPFKETVSDFESEVIDNSITAEDVDGAIDADNEDMSMAAAMGDGTDDSGQMSLMDASDDDEDEYDPIDGHVEQWVYDAVAENCGADGKPFTADDPPLEDYHCMNVVDEDTPVEKASTNDTALDPRHDLWDHPSKDSDWVTTTEAAKRELSTAWESLCEKGMITLDEDTSDGFIVVSTTETT